MATFRVNVMFDYDVPNDVDPDVFHDELRDLLESGQSQFPADARGWSLETVRDIGIEVLDD